MFRFFSGLFVLGRLLNFLWWIVIWIVVLMKVV